MIQDSAEIIKTTIEDIKFLQKLKKNVDPASCMSIGVRRGVPQDNEEVDDDSTRRPWRTFGFSGYDVNSTERGGMGGMRDLIDILIADRVKSLKFWVDAAARDAQKLCKADADAQELLKEIK
jgi:hypothetical protein